MKGIGFFSEMNIGYCNSGSIKKHIVDSVDYDKEEVIKYLKNAKRIAGCPREAIDCVTGETISPSFSVYNDGEYEWCDFLVYHIKKYNIALPEEFLRKVLQSVS
jgi:hypothetical protein